MLVASGLKHGLELVAAIALPAARRSSCRLSASRGSNGREADTGHRWIWPRARGLETV